MLYTSWFVTGLKLWISVCIVNPEMKYRLLLKIVFLNGTSPSSLPENLLKIL